MKENNFVDENILIVMQIGLHTGAVNAEILDQAPHNQKDQQNEEDCFEEFSDRAAYRADFFRLFVRRQWLRLLFVGRLCRGLGRPGQILEHAVGPYSSSRLNYNTLTATLLRLSSTSSTAEKLWQAGRFCLQDGSAPHRRKSWSLSC